MLHPRQEIVEIFSTFVRLEGGSAKCWTVDLKLQRSMQACLACASQAQTAKNFWAFYWHYAWLSAPTSQSSLARHHLWAFLQEACFWAAQKAATRYPHAPCNLSDHFNTAWLQFDQVLRGFRPDQGTTLDTYAATIFARAIQASLRQMGIADSCSDWGLLRKVSQKLLIESLHHAGLERTIIERYISAWNCFKELYAPTQPTTSHQLAQPSSVVWLEISELYNQAYRKSAEPACTREGVEQILIACAKAIRSYLYPPTFSLNQPKPGREEAPSEIAVPDTATPMEMLIIAEEQQTHSRRLQQFYSVLQKALQQLDAEELAILQLYYQKGYTQQDIAQQLALKQYTVSRRLTRSREQLLRTLAAWAQASAHIALDLNQLKDMQGLLENWLHHYESWLDKSEER